MVYLSADSLEHHAKSHHTHHQQQQQQQSTDSTSYDLGGVRTNFKKELASLNSNANLNQLQNQNNQQQRQHHHHHHHHADSKKSGMREPHCIFPGDLYPFLRKPLFLIVDSLNSRAFKVIR